MKRMIEAKQKYEEIPIPQELSERVMSEIENAQIKYQQQYKKEKRLSIMKKGATSVAAAVMVLAIGVNTSESFAKGVNDIPVIGAIANVLTFRSYEEKTENLNITVDIPSIELIAENLKGIEKNVNEEIYTFCEQYVEQAKQRMYEYKQAFMETGGTEKEWQERDIIIKVWYETKSNTEQYLSLMITGTESWASAYGETKYYNFDKKSGKWVTLPDVLGDNYVQIAEQSIQKQIEQRENETGMKYWYEDSEGINENTKFYMNESGNPVIVFKKYEIAPGAAGQQEFEIKMEY